MQPERAASEVEDPAAAKRTRPVEEEKCQQEVAEQASALLAPNDGVSVEVQPGRPDEAALTAK